jgi:hypothetical protein
MQNRNYFMFRCWSSTSSLREARPTTPCTELDHYFSHEKTQKHFKLPRRSIKRPDPDLRCALSWLKIRGRWRLLAVEIFG